ncbi:hypothetical protein Sinac_5478 [Singulisphaera acidiphila DSM 18658]|uniref:Uncharacterized protein n=1 Tax=Singulisphaera acidiphila (strain ATCC BAA-1392 / DSM 18658 / VKM B-2454 / MOB10) TaxID=886293 RepID=L0DJQ3_SINAD|nr:hypothetical protein Sinac_5478 [Singulisphaera acidiphila DSM 18658]
MSDCKRNGAIKGSTACRTRGERGALEEGIDLRIDDFVQMLARCWTRIPMRWPKVLLVLVALIAILAVAKFRADRWQARSDAGRTALA